jgi:hypothetical protein
VAEGGLYRVHLREGRLVGPITDAGKVENGQDALDHEFE